MPAVCKAYVSVVLNQYSFGKRAVLHVCWNTHCLVHTSLAIRVWQYESLRIKPCL